MWEREGAVIKLSLYAQSQWFTDCEINKNYEESSGSYIAFEWTGSLKHLTAMQ